MSAFMNHLKVIMVGGSVNQNVPEMLDERFLKALINVVRNCAARPKVAVRNAVRALAYISKIDEAKPKIIADGILEALKPLLSRTAENIKQTSKKEVFSYSACTVILNIFNEELIASFIDLEYTQLLLKMSKQSLVFRPAASVFALSIIKKIAENETGANIIIKNDGISVMLYLIEQSISMCEGNENSLDDVKNVMRFVTSIVSLLCRREDAVDLCVSSGFPLYIVRVFSLIHPLQISSEGTVIKDLNKENVHPLDVLLKMLRTDDGEQQVNNSTDLVTMYYMLLRLSSLDPNDSEIRRAMSKLSLGIGGSFTGEESIPVTASQLIEVLNDVCQKFCVGDNEVIFIVTSLIVHLANFPRGVESLMTDESMKTRNVLLSFFLQQDKTEVVQSILRNECVMLNFAFQSGDVIEVMKNNKIFSLVKKILDLYVDLNSEITESVTLLLNHLVSTEEGKKIFEREKFEMTLHNMYDYFNDRETEDERKEDIVSAIKQIIEQIS